MQSFIRKVGTTVVTLMLMIGILFPAGPAQAATAAELQAMIAALMAQIAVQGNGGGVSPAPVPTPTPLPTGTNGGKAGSFATFVQETKDLEGDTFTPVVSGKVKPVKFDRNLNKVELYVSPGNNNVVDDPWIAFDQVLVTVNGFSVRSVDTENKSTWRAIRTSSNRLVYAITLYRGNIVLPKNTAPTFEVSVAPQDNGFDVDGDTWSVWVPESGITTWNKDTRHVSYGPSRAFNYKLVEGEANDDRLVFLASDEDPDASSIISGSEASIFAYDIEADSDDDVSIDQLAVGIVTKGVAFDRLVDDIALLVNGQRVDDIASTKVVESESKTIVAFDVDGAIEIEAGEEITVEVLVELDDVVTSNDTPVTIQGLVGAAERNLTLAEGEDDITTFAGQAVGAVHTMVKEGTPVFSVLDVRANSEGENGEIGDFTVEFEVTAAGEDVYIAKTANHKSNDAGVMFAVDGPSTEGVTAVLSSRASQEGNSYVVEDGETEEFEVNVWVRSTVAGNYRVGLEALNYRNSVSGPIQRLMFLPSEDYRTPYVSLTGGITSEKLKVLTPNGGEQWQIGVTNTVTWSPYSYNPDVNPAKDVTAYLEVKNSDGTFKTLGKVQESGKASIHWSTGALNSLTQNSNYAPAGGGYYIRVVNNKTGAFDRSDKPFTLVAKSVDLKVNESDGPVTVGLNERVTLTWNAQGMTRCEIHNAYKDTARATQIGAVSLSGSMTGYLHRDPSWGPTLYCYKQDGSTVSDSVKRTAVVDGSVAVTKIVSPNGGETLDPSKAVTVKYEATGVSTISVALYKNDQWYAWIRKDLNIQTSKLTPITFVPSSLGVDITSPANSGSIYKLYITGQKADGSGYTDDKSDTTFSFVANAPVTEVAPKVNKFACDRSVATKVANGQLACYGMWDYGDAFGGDVNMCGSYGAGKTGCEIKTPVCTSGLAKATSYYVGSKMTPGQLTFASRLFGTSPEVVKKEVAGMWDYVCVPPVVTSAPTCTLVATPASIKPGQSVRLSWTSENTAGNGQINNGIGAVDPRNKQGFRDVTPTQTTTYTLAVQNASEQKASCSAAVTVVPGTTGTSTATTTGQVLGASTDVYAQMSAVLQGLQQLLLQFKSQNQ